MAELIIHTDSIKANITYLSEYFDRHHIAWSLITKVFSGDQEFLKQVLSKEVIAKINSIGDSRLGSLRNLRAVNPNMRTIYIKPPAEIYADEVVAYADISLNSSFSTIDALNTAAGKIGKVHQIIIMIEMGELREGVNQSEVIAFYERIFRLPNIEVIGIGSNLGCMYGVAPSREKLEQLADYKRQIERTFNRDLPLVSGGTSITLPLVESGEMPKDINHFRVGEAAFFGLSPLKNERFGELSTKTFEIYANIIELEEKNIVPEGTIGDAAIGHAAQFKQTDIGITSTKAILDFGLLDVDKKDLEPVDPSLGFVGITSDMLVLDLGSNKTADGKPKYKAGDKVEFKPNYMAVARLLNSKFIDKVYL